MSALRTSVLASSCLAVLAFSAAVPAAARADAVIGGSIGYFALKGEASRPLNDVIYRNLDFLAFDPHDFNGALVNGEFMVGLGDFLEAGVGAGFYQRTVPSIYADYVDADGTEVEQDLKLRISPVTFTARVFPTGRSAAVQPYLGGGVAVLAWRYTESGEFIDFNNGDEIFEGTFEDKGNTVAPVVFGGVRFRAGENLLIGGELRWHGGEATLDPSQGFAGDRLDLSGFSTLASIQVRF